MEMKRTVLYLIVAGLGVAVWNTWLQEYPPAEAAHTEVTSVASSSESPEVTQTQYEPGLPPSSSVKQASVQRALAPSSSSASFIHIKTDVLNISIDPHGGNIVSAELAQYPVSLEEKQKAVKILNGSPASLYLAETNVSGVKGNRILFSSASSNYHLKGDQKALSVVLKGKTNTGLFITKTYRFQRDRYAIDITQKITNQSGKTWTGSTYSQITRRQPEKEKGTFYTQAYDGAAVSSPSIPYKKVTYKDMNKADLSSSHPGGWIAMQQQYFVTAWVPSTQKTVNHFYTHVIPSQKESQNDVYIIGFVSPSMTLLPAASATSESTLYVGPEIAKRLNYLNVAGLDHTVDYGWLWPISKIIFWMMNHIHQIVGNWGWSIILTTVIIKIGFYWFSAQSFRSMARMRELQPRILALRERYGDDKQALSRETMALYRKEKVNPLGGCLPMLIQVPVFIGLYYMLMGSVELRQAPFILWIHDLSVKDPYYVLPILMGISMFVQQRLTPTAGDPMQQKVMMFLPVIFTVFFLHFPAGLVLYWLVNNCVQILQQWYVLKTYDAHQAKRHAKNAKNKKRKSKQKR